MSSNLIVNNIEVGAGATIYTAASNTLTFGTNGSEKVRISSGGEVGIGINNPEAYEANGNNLVVGNTTGHNGITILTGTDKDGRLGFADGTGAASYRGMIEYQHGTGANEFMKIAVAGDERLRITSGGKLIVGGASSADSSALINIIKNTTEVLADNEPLYNNASPAFLTVYNSNNTGSGEEAGINIVPAGNANGAISIYGKKTGSYAGDLIFRFRSGASTSAERLRITSGGKVCINNDTALSDLHVCTAGSSEQDGTFRIGGSNSELGLVLDYDQNSNTVSRITANPTYNNNSASLKLSCDGDANANQLVLLGSGRIGMGIADNTSVDLQVVGGSSNGSIRVGGSNGSGVGLDIEYSNSSNTTTTFKQNYRASNAGALIKFDSGYFTFHTSTAGTEALRVTSEGYIHAGNTGHGTNKVGGQSVTNEDFDPYFKILASTDNHWLMHLRSDTATGSNGIFMRAGNNSNNYSMYITGRDETDPHLITRGDGNVMIGCTGPVVTELFTVQRTNGHIAYFDHTGSNDDRVLYVRHRGATGSTNRTQIGFLDDNADEVGTIRSNGSSTSYNTSSDYRLKENVAAISDGITRLKTLKPYRFNFKKDPSTTVDGFFAHEVTAVPEAISGEKDGTEMQQIDQSKLVPLLTAALQEAVTEIESLKTLIKNSSSFAALKSSL